MKTETAKPSEEKRREQNMCGFFHAKRCTQLDDDEDREKKKKKKKKARKRTGL